MVKHFDSIGLTAFGSIVLQGCGDLMVKHFDSIGLTPLWSQTRRFIYWKKKNFKIMIYLITIFSLLFFLLAWRRLDWAVMFLIAALPAYLIRFSIFGLPLTLLEIMIWLVFLVWFITNWTRIKANLRESFKKNNDKIKVRYPFDWEMALMLLVALVAVGVAGFSNSSFGIWKAYFFEPALFFVVVLNVMKKPPLIPPLQVGQKSPLPPFIKGVELVLWSLAVSALAVSALAVYQKITGQLIDNPVWAAAATRRVVSFFGYPNAVGLYLGPTVLLFAGWLMSIITNSGETNLPGQKNPKLQAPNPKQITSTKSQTKTKNLFGNWDLSRALGIGIWNLKTAFISLTIILSLLSIYFAKSKGALMGVAAGLVVFGLLALPTLPTGRQAGQAGGKKARWATVAVILIMAAGVMAYQPARKLAYDTVIFKTVSGQIRLAGWRDSWSMLSDGRLITGAGLANFQNAVTPYHTQGIFIKDFSDPNAQRKLVFNEAYRTAHWQPLEIYLYPHNIILNFWSELGLTGVLLFIWIILKYFYLGISNIPRSCNARRDKQYPISKKITNSKSQQYLVIGLICAMVVIVVHGIVDAPYFKNDLAVMFWLLVAMMSLINLENKYDKNNT